MQLETPAVKEASTPSMISVNTRRTDTLVDSLSSCPHLALMNMAAGNAGLIF